MEKIKEAVARARAKRESTPAPIPLTRAKEKVQLEKNIQYSQTEVLDVNRELMRDNKLLPGIDDESVKTAFKILRTQVEQRLSANQWNTCAVTSPGPNQGKTTVAINLAISLAWEMHRTVLLVDLDLRSPSIHQRFGLDRSTGIIDYLLDDVPLNELFFNPGIERMVILPGGKPTPQSSELLSSPKMGALVDELKTRYPNRIIIFDLPPVLNSDDTIAFAPHVDSALLVVEDATTSKSDLSNAIETLTTTNILGVVLNNCEEEISTYDYG